MEIDENGEFSNSEMSSHQRGYLLSPSLSSGWSF
jgi:hypothetical protein